MKGNVLFKFIVPAVILAVLLIIFVFQPSKPEKSMPADEGLALTKEEARELGIEGDTSADTLRTLVGELRNMRSQMATANDVNTRLSKEKTDLEERSLEWEKQLEQTLARAKDEADSAKQESKNIADQVIKMMGDLEGKVTGGSFGSVSDMPIGLGLDDEENNAGSSSVVWIEPSDKVDVDARGGLVSGSFAFPSSFDNSMDSSSQDQRKNTVLKSIKSKITEPVGRDYEVDPVYTVAKNSTLLGSVSMTALIGRVPVDGTVNDPFPFKILIGKENLAANGIDLPEVTGAVMSGTAQGDWTLSCVRGQVESITFAFEDGTIRTVPEPIALRGAGPGGAGSGGSGGGGSGSRESIGYISDPYGIPCIAGERKSSAKEYIGNNTLVTAAGAAISRIFSKDGSNVQVSAGGTTITDNNQAFNSILQKGVGDIQDWVGKMYGQAFAAVYVAPHQQIAVHIDRELTIDYENNGRKVKHNEEINETVWLD